MLENFTTFLKKMGKKEQADKSKNAAKERLHLVLMQDRANVSADFLEMMKQEIVDVIKKYIDVDETEMDVKLENRVNNDGTSGAPALYANIPIMGINEEKKKESEELTKAKMAESEIKDDKRAKQCQLEQQKLELKRLCLLKNQLLKQKRQLKKLLLNVQERVVMKKRQLLLKLLQELEKQQLKRVKTKNRRYELISSFLL